MSVSDCVFSMFLIKLNPIFYVLKLNGYLCSDDFPRPNFRRHFDLRKQNARNV